MMKFGKHPLLALTAFFSFAGSEIAAAPDNLLFPVENPYSLAGAIGSRFGAAIGSDGKLFYVGAPEYTPGEFLARRGIIGSFSSTSSSLIAEYPHRAPYVPGSRAGTAIAANKKFLVYGSPGFDTTEMDPPTGGITFKGLGKLIYPDNDLELGEGGDELGSSAAIYKNVIVAGSPGSLSNRGNAVIVHIGAETFSSLSLKDVFTGFEAGDFAGMSVGISKNYIAVGCPGRTIDGQTSAGAVEVFNAKTFAHAGTLNNPSPEEGDMFGKALVVGGKLISVGAPYADRKNGPHKQINSGIVYQFKGGTTFTLTREIKPRNHSPEGHFGSSMAILGGLMLVGAPNDSEAADGDGTAYLISFKKGEVIRQVSSPNPVNGGRFGEGLAVMKGGRYVVGAPGETDSEGNAVGRAYVFKK